MTRYVRGASLSNYAEVAARVGLDPNAMLRRAGIDRRVLDEPDIRVPADSVADLLEASAAQSGCPTFGLQMAESRRLSDFGALSLLITHQATMRDALMTLVQYRRLVNESLVISVEEAGDTVVVREELLVGGSRPLRQAYELAIGVMFRLFRTVLGPRWRPLSVNFTHAPPGELTVHRRVFGSIVEFNSDFDGLTCSRADLDAPNPSADPVLARSPALAPTQPLAEQGSRPRRPEGDLHAAAARRGLGRTRRREPGVERTHPAAPARWRGRRVHPAAERHPPRTRHPLRDQQHAPARPRRRPRRLFPPELIQPLVRRRVRILADGVARPG